MTVMSDIETELGVTKSSVDQGDDVSGWVTVNAATEAISAWADITALLPTADYTDLNISMLDGSTVSVYGFDSENTVVVLYDDGASLLWCHCFEYANATDYGEGKTLQTPASELRTP